MEAWPQERGRQQVPHEPGPLELARGYKKQPAGPKAEGQGQMPVGADDFSATLGMGIKCCPPKEGSQAQLSWVWPS